MVSCTRFRQRWTQSRVDAGPKNCLISGITSGRRVHEVTGHRPDLPVDRPRDRPERNESGAGAVEVQQFSVITSPLTMNSMVQNNVMEAQ